MSKITPIIIVCFCIVFSIQLQAQQLAHRSSFGTMDFHFNPAMTAPGDYMESGVAYRQQWLGFESAPETKSAYIQFPFVNQNMSIGGTLEQDDVGPLQRNNVALSYSYKIDIGRYGQLSIGIQGSMGQYRFNENNTIATDPNDLLFLPDTKTGIAPNFGLGLFYVSDPGTYDAEYNSFFIGIGANQLLSSKLTFEDNAVANLKQAIHANAIIGGRIINNVGYIEPSLWIDYAADNIILFTGNVLFEMEDAFWAGLSLSSGRSAGIQAGWNLDLGGGQMRIGIMGTFSLSSLSQYQNSGLEFLAAYRFGL